MGATKNGEYTRTIEMLMEKTGKTKKEVAMILYFLYDSQCDNKDLKAMADLAIK
jgi:hypothetical protein